MRWLPALIVLALFVLAGLAGCTDLVCGDGTHEERGQCLPDIPRACGPGTVYEHGWCTIPDAGALVEDAGEDTRDGAS